MEQETKCIAIYNMWGQIKGYKNVKVNKAHGTTSSTDCNNQTKKSII